MSSDSDIVISYTQIYSVFIVLYRTFTFNDCPEAADEIQRQIKEAKEDLAAKGLKLWEANGDWSPHQIYHSITKTNHFKYV